MERTGGLLTGAERRGLLRPLASAHVTNAVGRYGAFDVAIKAAPFRD